MRLESNSSTTAQAGRLAPQDAGQVFWLAVGHDQGIGLRAPLSGSDHPRARR
jgi:hypothetical protein